MFARIFKSDLSNRDISGAKQAFGELSEFLTRFPQSQYAPYASQRLIYLRSLIAKSELVAADICVRSVNAVGIIEGDQRIVDLSDIKVENSKEMLIYPKVK